MTETPLIAQGALALQSATATPTMSNNMNAGKIQKTAEDFEAFFLGQMLQPMFASIDTSGPFGGGHAEKVWRSMMVDEIGKSIAKSGGIGLADSVQRSILAMQESSQ